MIRMILLCALCFVIGALASYYSIAFQIAERDLLLAQGQMLTKIERLNDLEDGRTESLKDWLIQSVHCERLLGEQLMVDWTSLQSEITSEILSKADQIPGQCGPQLDA